MATAVSMLPLQLFCGNLVWMEMGGVYALPICAAVVNTVTQAN